MSWDNLKHWNSKKTFLLKHVLLEISSGGILSGGILSGGILERGDIVRGDFVLGGYCSGGYCLGDIIRGDIVLEPSKVTHTSHCHLASLCKHKETSICSIDMEPQRMSLCNFPYVGQWVYTSNEGCASCS